MGTPAPRISAARLAGVGLVVFAANAALLVLQLVAGRLLSPFIGSSLETWTSVIGVFLAGIALGNGFGGRLADRYPTPRTLAALLGAGSLSALWMVALPLVLLQTGWHTGVELGPRIPLLAFLLCFPAGLTLSLLTPLAIKLGLPDIGKAGRVAGVVFALGTLGCLLGNYLTGFYLVPTFTLNTIVYGCAGTLAVLALVALTFGHASPATLSALGAEDSASRRTAILDLHQAYLIVFFASFGAMTLELTGVRLLAREVGVSLFTWTGVIGVMLAGTAAGNLLGGQLADRGAAQPADKRGNPLAYTLLFAAGATVCVFVTQGLISFTALFEKLGLMQRILALTFTLFFPPMFVLGMISPQVIRLAIPDVGHAGTVAGRIYGWSTAGAIAGTFATGYVLLSGLGAEWTILSAALLFCFIAVRIAPVWRSNAGLYLLSIVTGGIVGGFILNVRQGPSADSAKPGAIVARHDSNYYLIHIVRDPENPRLLKLNLDHLLHSVVDPDQPLYLHYKHEGIQMEILHDIQARLGNTPPRMLVIGGGGFTFPRCAKTQMPQTEVDVVEIDKAVTKAAEDYLGFEREKLGIPVHHMDGRQFVAEKVKPGTYDLVVLDAVNDYSVPVHLTTREFNDAVKKGLKPDGVYLLTVIDGAVEGKLWKAAYRTLRKSFQYVELVGTPEMHFAPDQREVFVLYASDQPLDVPAIWMETERRLTAVWKPIATSMDALCGGGAEAWSMAAYTMPIPHELVQAALDAEPELILTDQYAPVDNLLADVFRKRDHKSQSTKPHE